MSLPVDTPNNFINGGFFMKLIYGVKDKPKFGQVIVFAIQQLLAIMAATLVVPVIIGHGMSPVAALFGAGIGTIVYLLFTKFRSPVFLGSSFAFLGSMAAAFAGGVSVGLGYIGLILGAVFAGLVYVIIAIIVKFAGVKWINKLMPAVVIGPTVALIGLSLAGNAVGDMNKTNVITTLDPESYQVIEIVKDSHFDENGNLVKEGGVEYIIADADAKADENGVIPADKIHNDITLATDENGVPTKDENGNYIYSANLGSNYVAIICALVTLVVTILCSVYGKKFIKLIPFIIGISAGYAAASAFFIVGMLTGNPALMIIDFSPFTALVANGVNLSTFFTVPNFTFLTAFGSFSEINGTYIASIAVAYIPVAFVVFAEHIADHKNISSIIDQDLLEDPGLHRTLLGDGVGSMIGAIFGGCPNTTYGESVACVAITGNASVITIIATAIGAIAISFLAPFVAIVNSIPSCVMGGVCMALYGFIAVSGLKMIKKVDLDQGANLFTVSAILIAGIGGLTLTFGQVTVTSIACALILGIFVNLIVNKSRKTSDK